MPQLHTEAGAGADPSLRELDGYYTLIGRIVDQAGNVSTSLSRQMLLDRTPPEPSDRQVVYDADEGRSEVKVTMTDNVHLGRVFYNFEVEEGAAQGTYRWRYGETGRAFGPSFESAPLALTLIQSVLEVEGGVVETTTAGAAVAGHWASATDVAGNAHNMDPEALEKSREGLNPDFAYRLGMGDGESASPLVTFEVEDVVNAPIEVGDPNAKVEVRAAYTLAEFTDGDGDDRIVDPLDDGVYFFVTEDRGRRNYLLLGMASCETGTTSGGDPDPETRVCRLEVDAGVLFERGLDLKAGSYRPFAVGVRRNGAAVRAAGNLLITIEEEEEG